MLGCDLGTMFRTTVAGGSYQDGLTVHLQGVPPGMMMTEEEIYQELLLPVFLQVSHSHITNLLDLTISQSLEQYKEQPHTLSQLPL